MDYQSLMRESRRQGILVLDEPLLSRKADGMYFVTRRGRPVICLNPELNMEKRTCVLAEELGHYYTCTHNILSPSAPSARRQEALGRQWAYRKLLPPDRILYGVLRGASTPSSLSRFVRLPDDFVCDALTYYQGRYGCRYRARGYTLSFRPLSATRCP